LNDGKFGGEEGPMSLLSLFVVVWLGLSLVAALVIYAACVTSGRASAQSKCIAVPDGRGSDERFRLLQEHTYVHSQRYGKALTDELTQARETPVSSLLS
jgi:hypothetical protein